MAKFPVRTAQGSLPGVSGSVEGHLDIPTDPLGQVMQQAGGAVAELGQGMFRAQADTELVDSTMAAREKFDKLMLGLKSRVDSSSFQDEYDTLISSLESQQPKNGLAARNYRQWLKQMRPVWQNKVITEAAAKTEDRWWASLANKRAEAIEKGELGGLRGMLTARVQRQQMSEEEAEGILHGTQRLAARTRMEKDAGNDPDAWLKANPNPKVMLENYPGSLASDYKYIQGIGVSQSGYNKRQRGEWWAAIREDTLKKADAGMSVSEFRSLLKQTQGLELEDEIELMGLFRSAQSVLHETGTDPLRTTQNYAALNDVLMKFRAGEITSQEQLHRLWLHGNKVNWSVEKQEELRRRLDPRDTTSGRFYSDPIVKKLFESYDSVYLHVDRPGDPLRRDSDWKVWGQGREVFERELRRIWKSDDPRKYEQMDQLLQIATKATKTERVKGVLSRWIEEQEERAVYRLGGSGRVTDILARPAPVRSEGFTPLRLHVAESDEPKTVDEFVAEVKRLKLINMSAAKQYYDRWAGKFQ